ncbi:MAG: hypothetical protein KDB90_00195 [Planctomycetes bacterium]|nr:hypothetical protein [Planctomycetota bacterium]
MGKFAFAVFLLEAVIITAVVMHSPQQVNASDIVTRALDASMDGMAVAVGDYTWVEDGGVGVRLPPAPLTEGAYPRLLAAKWVDATRSSALWELGPQGFTSLQHKLEADGATFSGSENYPWRPRGYPVELVAHRTPVAFTSGRRGLIVDWSATERSFAIVVVDSTADQASRRADDLLREVTQIKGVGPDAIAPLFFQGRYTAVLDGWKREDSRVRKRVQNAWLSLRVFQVPVTEFENAGRLQFELENKLDAAGFKRSAGLKPSIAGVEGFVGEYYGNDGFVQRIAYVRLDGGYLVALMQGPESLRGAVGEEMDAFTRTLQQTGISGPTGPGVLYFNRVGKVRCLAWQDGRRVLWGAFFDDGRQQPALWRQEGVGWNIQLTQGGQMIREREGEANTSRALNPLVDPELRALDLPEGFTGDVELALKIGSERATTRITIR